MKFPVEQDAETLIEYRDHFSDQYQHIEHLTIGLENCPEDLSAVHQLHEIFQQLRLSSTQLNLTPLVENLAEIVLLLEFIMDQDRYPKSFSEYLLILIDRLMMMADDVLHTSSINMLATQNIHVSLQTMILCQSIDEMVTNIPLAISQVTKSATDDNHSLSDDFDIVLFDDDEPEISNTTPDNDPITSAHAYMTARENEPLIFLSQLADLHTNHGYKHTHFLHEIALAMNFMENEPVSSEELWAGICLHDIGLGHLAEILSASRRLSPEEIEQVRKHPVVGAHVCEKTIYGTECRRIVLEHHERIDGRGYPYGITGESISEGAKILAIVDSFHAMISNRPYKRHIKNILRAVSEINACSNTLYDPRWVEVFNQCIKQYWLPKYHPSIED